MSAMHVFLGGEGRNELGSRSGHPVDQTDDAPGVVASILRRCHADGWRVVGATEWKNISKLSAKGPTPKEERNVLGLVLEAKRAKAHTVAFIRDADGDPKRVDAIHKAIEKAKELFPDVEVIGGVAVPVLEAWLLALVDEPGTERLAKAKAQSLLEERGVRPKDTHAMVKLVTESNLERLPQDAVGLRRWLATAAEVLPRRVREFGTEV